MIDRQTLDNFRQDFEKAMGALEKQYGFIIDLGSITYSATSFSGKLEVHEGDSRDDLNEQEFKKYCKSYGLDYDGKSRLFFVTYPLALTEGAVAKSFSSDSNLLRLRRGDSIDRDELLNRLGEMGFVRTDFVGEPGQFAVRGSVIDIFSYSDNNPYRFTFFGDEIDGISVFDCGTQLSKEKREDVEIYPDLSAMEDASVPVLCLLPPEKTTLWMDSAELYSKEEFYSLTDDFRKVFLQVPTGEQGVEPVKFNITLVQSLFSLVPIL